jgi:hypothetical protein
MSHEPGRERHMQHRCENCRRATTLAYNRRRDEYLCEQCTESLVGPFVDGYDKMENE